MRPRVLFFKGVNDDGYDIGVDTRPNAFARLRPVLSNVDVRYSVLFVADFRVIRWYLDYARGETYIDATRLVVQDLNVVVHVVLA